MRKLDSFSNFTLPEWSPVIAHETTDYGWRGLTAEGEVLEVRGNNGHAVVIPENEMIVYNAGRPVARRNISNDVSVNIDRYLEHFNNVVDCYKSGRLTEAMREADASLMEVVTSRAVFNRAMVLLAAGHWQSGFAEYFKCEQVMPFIRPQAKQAIAAGLRPWCGENLRGKRLLVLHAHGFGDSIMMLRYISQLQAMGIDVIMEMPQELNLLALQHGAVKYDGFFYDGMCVDYFCPILHLLHLLHVTPETVSGAPYFFVPTAIINHWRERIDSKRRNVGIAWSIGKPSAGDYPREIALAQLITSLGDVDVHSVQIQDSEHARRLGVKVHDFHDFTECAAMMLAMDQIVSVDTAALHLAGAIGHPNVCGLLSHWASWRWLARWYNNVKLCRQTSDGDWASALAQI